MESLLLLARFVGGFMLIALGIRSYVRIARRARAAGKLSSGPADTNGNATAVYGYAFSSEGRSLDTWLLLLGFGGGLAWMLFGGLVVASLRH